MGSVEAMIQDMKVLYEFCEVWFPVAMSFVISSEIIVALYFKVEIWYNECFSDLATRFTKQQENQLKVTPVSL